MTKATCIAKITGYSKVLYYDVVEGYRIHTDDNRIIDLEKNQLINMIINGKLDIDNLYITSNREVRAKKNQKLPKIDIYDSGLYQGDFNTGKRSNIKRTPSKFAKSNKTDAKSANNNNIMHGTCVYKYTDYNNKISNYKIALYDRYEVFDIKPNDLKHLIFGNNLLLDNLALYADGRLMDKKKVDTSVNVKGLTYLTKDHIRKADLLADNKSISFIVNKNIQDIKNKANLTGATIHELNNHIILIESNNSIAIATDLDRLYLNNGISLFYNTGFTCVNMNNVDTSLLNDASNMFSCMYNTPQMNVSNMDTSHIRNMQEMFADSEFDELDLSNFDFSNVENIEEIFSECRIKVLNLGKFNINTHKIMKYFDAFSECKIGKLIITNKSNSLGKIIINKNRDYIGNLDEFKNIFTIIE